MYSELGRHLWTPARKGGKRLITDAVPMGVFVCLRQSIRIGNTIASLAKPPRDERFAYINKSTSHVGGTEDKTPLSKGNTRMKGFPTKPSPRGAHHHSSPKGGAWVCVKDSLQKGPFPSSSIRYGNDPPGESSHTQPDRFAIYIVPERSGMGTACLLPSAPRMQA
jgi:hypothetical protein